MRPLNHSCGGNVKLRDFGIEYRFLAFDIAAARLPGNPGVVDWRQHQFGDSVAATGVALDGNRLGRKHIYIQINNGELELIYEAILNREVEAGFGVALRDLQLVLDLDVKQAAGLREQLLGAFRAGGR